MTVRGGVGRGLPGGRGSAAEAKGWLGWEGLDSPEVADVDEPGWFLQFLGPPT